MGVPLTLPTGFGGDIYGALTPIQEATTSISSTSGVSTMHEAKRVTISLQQDVETGGCQESGKAFTNQIETLDSTSWLLGHDFDLSAFDFSGFDCSLNGAENLSEYPEVATVGSQLAGICESAPKVLDLRTIWYTQIRSMGSEYGVRSGSATPREPDATSRTSIDEVYRIDMANTLRPPLRDEPLPSIDFLVSRCFQLKVKF